jgi:predicted nucleic acid-binding protein
MRPCYFDTGVVLKLLVPEPLSSTVLAFLSARRVAVPYSRLVAIETENALQAKAHRKEITGPQLRACRQMIHELLAEGRFYRPVLSLDDVAVEALSRVPKVTGSTGCRTLDLLHVVSAQLLGCTEFVTTDQRQAASARLAGLAVTDLTAWQP